MSWKEIRTPTALIMALVCMIACSGGTLSYMTAVDEAKNTFTVGSQVSEIDETWSPPDSMVKGQSYTKKVTVKNTGTTDCYVRVWAEFEDSGTADSVSVDWNTSKWTAKQPDGYYYYKYSLAPGKKTDPLFTKLTAKADVTELGMIVYEETVQAAGSESPESAFEF